MYDAFTGRFIQPDTLVPEPGSSQGYNRYAYVNNNPIRYTDPSGHMAWQGEGGSDTAEQIGYDKARLENLKCQSGDTAHCSYGEQHPVELAGFVTTSLITGAASEAYILGGGLAATADSVVWNAGVACLKSTVCRYITGAGIGVAATQLPNRLARVMPVNIFETATSLGPPNNPDVFVSPADDLAGLTSSVEISQTLSLYNSSGGYIEGPFAVLEFDAVDGIT